MRKTAEALDEASDEMAAFEESGVKDITSVSCASTFGEMAQAVENLAGQLP